jgi:signal transduction histidine kinase
MHGDRRLLQQMLTNLLDNAVQHTPQRNHRAHRPRTSLMIGISLAV